MEYELTTGIESIDFGRRMKIRALLFLRAIFGLKIIQVVVIGELVSAADVDHILMIRVYGRVLG